MSVETELVAVMGGNAAVAALVGTRIYPVALPQNATLPALVYQELNTVFRLRADGDSGQRESRFQVSVWAEGSATTGYAQIKAGRAALVGALQGYAGGSVDRVSVEGAGDDFDPETGWFREAVTVLVHWREEV